MASCEEEKKKENTFFVTYRTILHLLMTFLYVFIILVYTICTKLKYRTLPP
jgi:hypothetical protein